MKSRKILFILIIFIVCFISAFLNQTVQATPMSEKLYFGIAEIRTTTNMGYAMGDPDSGAEKIWKIVQYSNTSYNDPTEVSAYCIKANTGFAGAGSTDTYDVSYNMKTEKTEIAAQNDILNHLVNDGQYENLLALADLLYVNPLFINESYYQNELDALAEKVLKNYAVGKLLIAGDNRFLSADLISFLYYLVQPYANVSEKAYRLQMSLLNSVLKDSEIYAPGAAYDAQDRYTLLRNPHIARNEEVLAVPAEEAEHNLRDIYLSHLTDVVMVSR